MSSKKFQLGDLVEVITAGMAPSRGRVIAYHQNSYWPYHVKLEGLDGLLACAADELTAVANKFPHLAPNNHATASYGASSGAGDSTTYAAMPIAPRNYGIAVADPGGFLPSWHNSVQGNWVTPELRKERRDKGCCEECGELRPVSAFGLLECTSCAPPPVKQ